MPHHGVHGNESSRGRTGPEESGDDGRATSESIRSATRNALAAADERGCRSLVVPALGYGVGGFDLREGATLIADEMRNFDPDHLEDVRFIAYGDDGPAVVDATEHAAE